MIGRLKLLWVLVVMCGLVAPSVVQAEAYTDWQHEYDGSDENTLALWNFAKDQPTADGSGNGYTLTIAAPAEVRADGKFGAALVVPYRDDEASYVQARNSQNLFPAASDPSLTVELWAKFAGLDHTTMFLIDKQYTDKSGYQLVKYGKGLRFAVGDGTKILMAVAPFEQVVTETDTWYHLAGTWNADDDTVRLYVNGRLVGAKRYPGAAIVGGNRPVRIGNRLGSSYSSRDGVIDGVRISDVAHGFTVPDAQAASSPDAAEAADAAAAPATASEPVQPAAKTAKEHSAGGVQGRTLASEFFEPAGKAGRELPADLVYPRGRRFPISLFSVGGSVPEAAGQAALKRVTEGGFTLIGPQYELNHRVLTDAKDYGLKAIYMLQPHDAQGERIMLHDLTMDNLAQAVRSIRQQVIDVVESDLNPYVAWWYLQPEEVRFWYKQEMAYLEHATAAIRDADPLDRPIWMYEPNHRNAESLTHTAPYLDLVGKGMYTNYASMRDQRIWTRWTIEQQIQAIKQSGSKAIPIAVPEMFEQPEEKYLPMIPRWVRHDVYSALVSGAKGIVIFSMRERPKFEAHERYYQAYAQVAEELTGPMKLGQVFLFGEQRDAITVDVISGPARVSLLYPNGGVKQPRDYPSLNFLDVAHGEKRYLFVVNSANETVKAMIGGLPYGNIQVHRLFDDTSDAFRVSEGEFPVEIEALGVRGFRFEQGE